MSVKTIASRAGRAPPVVALAMAATAIALALPTAASPASTHWWYQTRSNAQATLHKRFGDIDRVICIGVPEDGSFVRDNSRWFRHFICVGRVRGDGTWFSLKYHQRSKYACAITNLHHTKTEQELLRQIYPTSSASAAWK